MSGFSWVEFDAGSAEHIGAHDRLMRQAFATTPARNVELRAQAGEQNTRLLFKEGEAVAAVSIEPCGQYWNGRRVPCTTLCGLAVGLDARGQGVGVALAEHTFREVKQRGIPMISLYASNMGYYRSVGYEVSATRTRYRSYLDAWVLEKMHDLPPIQHHPLPEDWVFSQGMLPSWAPVAALYQSFAARQNGMFDRSAYHWATKITRNRGLARGFDRCLPQDVFLIGKPDAPSGYAACSYSKSDTMLIDDWITLTEPATRSLIHMLSLQRANWQFIEWYGAPVDRLSLLLANHGLPYQRWWVTEQTYLMTRMLDIPAALAARGYGEASGEVVVEVTDHLLQENTGHYHLKLHHGAPEVTQAKPANVPVATMHVRGLSALYSGILSPRDLLASGHLSADEAALAALERIFACAAPWNTDQC